MSKESDLNSKTLPFEPNVAAMREYLGCRKDSDSCLNRDRLEEWLTDPSTSDEMVMEVTGLSEQDYHKVFTQKDGEQRKLLHNDEICKMLRLYPFMKQEQLSTWQTLFLQLLARHLDGLRFEEMVDEYAEGYFEDFGTAEDIIPDLSDLLDCFNIYDEELNDALQEYAAHHQS